MGIDKQFATFNLIILFSTRGKVKCPCTNCSHSTLASKLGWPPYLPPHLPTTFLFQLQGTSLLSVTLVTANHHFNIHSTSPLHGNFNSDSFLDSLLYSPHQHFLLILCRRLGIEALRMPLETFGRFNWHNLGPSL